MPMLGLLAPLHNRLGVFLVALSSPCWFKSQQMLLAFLVVSTFASPSTHFFLFRARQQAITGGKVAHLHQGWGLLWMRKQLYGTAVLLASHAG